MKWLITPFAIMVHATFSVLTVLVTCELFAGNHGPGGDYGLGRLFCLVAYPVMLLLLWLNWRVNGGGAGEQQTLGSMRASDSSLEDSDARSSVDRMGGPPEGDRSDVRWTTGGCQERKAQEKLHGLNVRASRPSSLPMCKDVPQSPLASFNYSVSSSVRTT